MVKQMHVISFNVPFPPDYGGVIDVFYKLKALHEEGVMIHLHCFQYGRPEAKELEKICASVNYYPRKTFFRSIATEEPFIVHSRKSDDLLDFLIKHPYPILFEGLHCCHYLDHPQLKNHRKLARMHNVEWKYYKELSRQERSTWKKLYLKQESIKLKKYEKILTYADEILPISRGETDYFKEKYENVDYLPAFHGNKDMHSLIGKGGWCLYQGNLSIPENEEAAHFLVNKVFADLVDIPLIIAGKKPSKALQHLIEKHDHILLKTNPSNQELKDLLQQAHINILPTFQETGIKLKLLNALFNGRFCIVNTPMIHNTSMESLCTVTDDPEIIKIEVERLMGEEFTNSDIQMRKLILDEEYSNKKNAEKLVKFLFPATNG